MVTATSSRIGALAVAGGRTVTGALAAAAAIALWVAGCGISARSAGVTIAPATHGTARLKRSLPTALSAAGWHLAELPGGGAVLAYPPGMRLIRGDTGTVSAASFSASGAFLMYLNATPRQGAESLADWPTFRVSHQRADSASAVKLLAVRRGVRFIGGTGTCVVDAYVTKVRANHFTELACFVRGRMSASVIVAAAPTASWTSVSGLLTRAVAAYQVR